MKYGWHAVFHEDAMMRLLQMRCGERERFLRCLDVLLADPFRRPDAYTKDADGRTHFISYADRFRIVYWLDGFGRELRVVNAEPIRP